MGQFGLVFIAFVIVMVILLVLIVASKLQNKRRWQGDDYNPEVYDLTSDGEFVERED